MLASFNRYTFKPHHFVLAHDIVLDNVELDTEQYDGNNFDCNKENDTQFTWDFPVNSSNLLHSSNTSLESLNMKNSAKSKFGTAKTSLQEHIKRHKTDMMETMCSLRIEDFAKIGTDCVRLNLDSIVSRKNLKMQHMTSSVGHTDWSQQQQQQQQLDLANESMTACTGNASVNQETSSDSSHRVSRKLPEIPNALMRETVYLLSQDSVPASSLIRTPSLAEELQAALLAENSECTNADYLDSLPKGFHLNLYLHNNTEESDFSLDLSELGSPEQIDPVNKYSNFFDPFAAKQRSASRRSCVVSETNSVKNKQHVRMPSVVKTVEKGEDTDNCHSFTNAGTQSDTADNVDLGRHSVDLGRHSADLGQHSVDLGRHSADLGRHIDLAEKDRSENVLRNSADAGGTDGASTFEPCGEGKDRRVKTVGIEDGKPYQNNSDIPQNNTCSAAINKKCHPTVGSGGGGTSVEFDPDEIVATHRGCHKFVPRHPGELAIEIGDYIYVQVEDDDLWCEGINLHSKHRGIFPTAYAMDLSLFDDESHNSKFFVKYLGSIEVAFHKGNDVLCQAINKLAAARLKTAESNPLPQCCLEITEHGVKMTGRPTQKKLRGVSASADLKTKLASKIEQGSSEDDHLFLLKNISFCGYHPKNDRYLGFITKHPLEMRFACHVFQSDRSSKVIAEAIGDAFRKFYQEYLAYVYPTEDIYLE